ncbi:PEP-CTERM sorting domain-containing protein [Cerasicoccus arenae]|uniref:Ice-binding protein C-terminal domain-containing protein n=1 Tax=Cerasicoccus arenae TaxID=424488 RepID=A0A8J3DIK3_9BACT|nr:PEP-CTERM sorting domain-containing protein [Cerasicoccus arenae]MBK1858073.1 PEP-CTERM sorting domain-containing protein [Cerasicoccus arenae]GHC06910.1 hypothetical protein GCM10007047_24960 [Cerasicoccus arenae]
MKTIAFTNKLLLGVLITSTSLSAQTVLLENASVTSFDSGNLGRVNFTTPLPEDKDTLAEFAVGDSITMTFTLNYEGVGSSPADGFSFGLQGGTGGDRTIFYGYLLPIDDNAVSDMRYRDGGNGRYMASGGTPITGTTTFNTFYMSEDFTPPSDSYDMSLSLTKTSTGYEGVVTIAGNSYVSSDLSFPSEIEDYAINRVGFRGGNVFTNETITNIDVVYASVPEPGTYALLLALGALGMVTAKRARNQRNA